MKRGILEIKREELNALTTRFDVRKYMGTTVANKVVAALDAQGEAVRLELSEEELEILMDEVTLPSPQDGPDMISLRKKMIDLMTRFRSSI